MISGIGQDIIEVERVAQKIGKEKGFREMVFSKNEIEYCESKPNKYEHYAARFAAKEAFFKAIGTGWKNGTAFNEVEVFHEDHGRPGLTLLGSTARTLSSINTRKIFLSISHLRALASAVVVIEE
jgi:holo-[acyl-carrier protein] synthase